MDKEILKDLLEKISTAGCYQAMVISGVLFSGGGVFLASTDFFYGCYDLLIIFGMVLVVIGFVLWIYRNQKHIDNMLELMVAEKKRLLPPLKEMNKIDAKKQEKEKRSQNSEGNDFSSASENKRIVKNNIFAERDILKFVYRNIVNYKSINYDVRMQVKLKTNKGDIYFDVLAESRSHSRAFIVEIKTEKPTERDYNRLYNMLHLYKESRKKNAKVIVVYPIDDAYPVENNSSDSYIKEIGIPRETIEKNDQSRFLIDFNTRSST